jgi:hypothetical protein
MNGETASDWIFGILMAVSGLIGLVMAAGARDPEIFIFGGSLAVFAVAFIAGLRRRHTAAMVAAPVAAEAKAHG